MTQPVVPMPAPAPPKTLVVDTAGNVGEVDASQLAAAQEQGYAPATAQDIAAAKQRETYGGAGGVAAAAALGGARGLTLGLSDPAIVALGGEHARQALQGYREENPIASGVGELAGVVAPTLVSAGGAGALGVAKTGLAGAGILPRAASTLGALAERGVGRLVGEGAEGLGARMLQRGAALGAQGAVEGALYGVGSEISEDALGDHALTAEKLFAAAKKGALWGGVTGGALGAAGEGVATGTGRLGELAMGLVKREGETLPEALDRMSGEFAFRSAGGRKSLTEGANKYAGGYEAVGKVWRDEAPALVGKRSFQDLTLEDLAKASEAGLEREGQRIGKQIDRLDEIAAARGIQPKAVDVVADIESQIGELAQRAGTGPAIAKLQEFSNDVQRITGLSDGFGKVIVGAEATPITFKKLKELSVDARNLAFMGKANPELSAGREQLAEVRRKLEDRILTAGEDVAKYEAAPFRAEYLDAKRKYQAFKLLGDATESGAGKAGTNRFMSLTDNIQGAVAGGIGTMIGGPIAGAAGNVAGALANRFVRTRGDFIASDMLSQLSKLSAMQRTVAKVNARMDEGVRGLLESGAVRTSTAVETRPKVPARKPAAQYQKIAADILATANNPAAMTDRIGRFIGDTHVEAPKIAGNASMVAARAMASLGARAPRAHVDDTSLTPHLLTPHVDPQKLRAFTRYIEAVDDPLSLLDDMKAGHISRDAVAAVRDNYPKLFAEMQMKVREQIATAKTPPTYAKSTQLGILLDTPTNWTLTPAGTKALQSTYAENGNGDQVPDATAQQGPARPLQGASQVQAQQSGSDRLEGGT